MGRRFSAGPSLRGPAHDAVQGQVPKAADRPREGDHRKSQGADQMQKGGPGDLKFIKNSPCVTSSMYKIDCHVIIY